MKVLLVADDTFLPTIGGAELVIYNIARELSNRGFDVLVLCSGSRKDNDLVRQKYDINFRMVRYPKIMRKFNSIILMLYILYFYLLENYRVIHAHCTCRPGYACAMVKKILPVEYVLTPHGADIQRLPEINYGIRLNEKYNKRACYAVSNALYVTSISSSILEELKGIPGLDLTKIYDIPNGFDSKVFSGSIKHDIRQVFNLPLDSIVLISVGRNHIKKNYAYALRSLKLLEETCPEEIWKRLVYIIIGRNVSENQGLVNELGLQDKVVLSSPMINDILADCYRTSDIFLNPSLIEGFALVNVEAMAAGLPVIATDVPGNRDAVNNGVGYLVDINSPQQMTDKILFLLKNLDLKEEVSKNCLLESQKYIWENIVDRYIQVYNMICARKP